MMPADPIRFCLDCRCPLGGAAPRACPECGREFDAEDPATFAVDRGELVKLYAGSSGVDVYVLRDMLGQEGIPSVIMGEALSSGRGDLPMTAETLPSLWVGQNDADRAMPIALEYDRVKKDGIDASLSGGDWKCPGCGEEVEGHFSACWSCGGERA
jgi:uncharacterized protein (UPF0212 family)